MSCAEILTHQYSDRLLPLYRPPQLPPMHILNGLIGRIHLHQQPLEYGLATLEVTGVDDGLGAERAEYDDGGVGEHTEAAGQLPVF